MRHNDISNSKTLCEVLSILIDEAIDNKRRRKPEESDWELLGRVRQKDGCVDAVMVLLEKIKPNESVVDFVVTRFLDIFKKHLKNSKLFLDTSALEAATRAVYFGASRYVAATVIEEVARQGWYGRLEDMTNRLLHREPTPQEVLWLVDAYVKDKGSRSSDEETSLNRLSRRYLPREQAEKVARRIEEFVSDFENSPDI